MLGHPAFVAGDVGGDAEGEALLAEQGVAAVAGAVGPDLAGFGEVDDVLGVVAGPGDVLLAGCERRADGVHAGDDALVVLVDLGEDGSADAGHDAHVDDGVGGVGELDADLRHGRADGAHGEGQDVHGAAAHAAAEERLELLAHDEGIFPVVGGAGVVLGERADEGAVFDAGDVVGRRSGRRSSRARASRRGVVKVPASTSLSQRQSFSASEPSTQWMAAGWERSAIFSTQRMRCLLVVGGVAVGRKRSGGGPGGHGEVPSS